MAKAGVFTVCLFEGVLILIYSGTPRSGSAGRMKSADGGKLSSCKDRWLGPGSVCAHT